MIGPMIPVMAFQGAGWVSRAPVVATNGRIVIAEDHHPEGGLGSAVIAMAYWRRENRS